MLMASPSTFASSQPLSACRLGKAYALFCCSAGFVTFVLRLQKRMYTYQFAQYAWTHMILLVVFIPSSFFVSNIFDGLMWFLLPCSLVIINDIGAYLFGMHLLCPLTSSGQGLPCFPALTDLVYSVVDMSRRDWTDYGCVSLVRA